MGPPAPFENGRAMRDYALIEACYEAPKNPEIALYR